MAEEKLKGPDEILDWDVDFTDFLTGAESVASATIEITPSGELAEGTGSFVTVVSSPTVKVWLSGGNVRADYDVKCKGVSDSTPARTFERTLTVRVEER